MSIDYDGITNGMKKYLIPLCLPYSDIEKIQAGIGDKVAVFLEHFTSFLTGYTIAFAFSWKLALVMSATLPCMTILGGVMAKVYHTSS